VGFFGLFFFLQQPWLTQTQPSNTTVGD